MFHPLVKPQSFIITNGETLDSPDSVEINKEKISKWEPITIYTISDYRTGHRDILLTKLFVSGSYALWYKDEANITVLEDWKDIAKTKSQLIHHL